MEIAARWAVLAAATLIAGGAAFGMAWVLLFGALHLMQPARRPAGRTFGGLERGTRLVARSYLKS